ncbi:hypothetical protein ACTI_33350 [Actinoplanes sp. OR16]|nr:hypothetical protein ACTI_33350 [Actinoplanes sp. OR16]
MPERPCDEANPRGRVAAWKRAAEAEDTVFPRGCVQPGERTCAQWKSAANLSGVSRSKGAGVDDDAIQLISDGDGLAVIGDPRAVEQFLRDNGWWAGSQDFREQATAVLGAAATVVGESAEMTAGAFRWVQLTEDSAALCEKFGLRASSATGAPTGVIKADKGRIRTYVQFVKESGSLLTPAAVAGVAGILAQLAAQKQIARITAYLTRIDAGVTDILANQEIRELAALYGIGAVLDRAMIIQAKTGEVDPTLWSTVQGGHETIATACGYALGQLERIVGNLESKTGIGSLAQAAADAEREAHRWLVVIARCFQLERSLTVVELDRVSQENPEKLDAYREGAYEARRTQLDHVLRRTRKVRARLDTVVDTANDHVFTNPRKSPAVVESSNKLSGLVADLYGLIGIDAVTGEPWQARPWQDAAKQKAIDAGPAVAATAVTGAVVVGTVVQTPELRNAVLKAGRTVLRRLI